MFLNNILMKFGMLLSLTTGDSLLLYQKIRQLLYGVLRYELISNFHYNIYKKSFFFKKIFSLNQTCNVVHVLRDHMDCVSFLSWSPDDSKILTCGQDNVLKLWSVEVKKNFFYQVI